MTELEVYVDKDAWLYLKLKKDGELIDIICLENYEKVFVEYPGKSPRLVDNLRKANKIFCKLCPDKLTVKSDYQPFSSDSIRKFVTYTPGALYE